MRFSQVRIQTQRKFTGVWHCVLSTCKAEGVSGRRGDVGQPGPFTDQDGGPKHLFVLQVNGFYKGISMPVTTVSISSSVVFGTYRNCLQGLCMMRGGGADTPPHKLDIFLSGLAAGVAQVLLSRCTAYTIYFRRSRFANVASIGLVNHELAVNK